MNIAMKDWWDSLSHDNLNALFVSFRCTGRPSRTLT